MYLGINLANSLSTHKTSSKQLRKIFVKLFFFCQKLNTGNRSCVVRKKRVQTNPYDPRENGLDGQSDVLRTLLTSTVRVQRRQTYVHLGNETVNR